MLDEPLCPVTRVRIKVITWVKGHRVLIAPREPGGRKRQRESRPWVDGGKVPLEGVNRRLAIEHVISYLYFEISIIIISERDIGSVNNVIQDNERHFWNFILKCTMRNYISLSLSLSLHLSLFLDFKRIQFLFSSLLKINYYSKFNIAKHKRQLYLV